MGIKIANRSTDKVDMVEQGQFTTLQYKQDMSYRGDSTITVELTDEDRNITSLRVIPTCGCTVSETDKQDNVYVVKIVYDTERRGSFNKQIQVPYTEDGKKKKHFLTITGRVI